MVSRVCLDCQDHLESLENQVKRVLLEKLVLLEQQVQGEKEVLLEKEVKLGPMVCRDLKVVQVHQDQMDQREALVQLVLLEKQELQDFKECLEKEA